MRLEHVPDGEELVLRQAALDAGGLDLLVLGVLQAQQRVDGGLRDPGLGFEGLEVDVLSTDDSQRHGVMRSLLNGTRAE
ncbi:hypothetical protein, partial [Pseudomonas viridiflava]|uniref:hypothetical protein n=1 Tax=Pseudomonas viridiflava TaxID=33069 RepID=UPI00197ED185